MLGVAIEHDFSHGEFWILAHRHGPSHFAAMPTIIFLPLQQKVLKTLQNEVIFPLITRKTLIYTPELFNHSYQS